MQSERAEEVGAEFQAEPVGESEVADVQQQVVALKVKLEEAASEAGRVQSSLTSQRQLEQLLKQGRVHLQDLRTRLEQTSAERDRLQAEVSRQQTARQTEAEEFQRQIDDLAAQLQKMAAERQRAEAQLEEREAAHQQFADDRADERANFERLLAEAGSTHRDLLRELDDQRQQLDSLRDAATRAQSLAREIVLVHESGPTHKTSTELP